MLTLALAWLPLLTGVDFEVDWLSGDRNGYLWYRSQLRGRNLPYPLPLAGKY